MLDVATDSLWTAPSEGVQSAVWNLLEPEESSVWPRRVSKLLVPVERAAVGREARPSWLLITLSRALARPHRVSACNYVTMGPCVRACVYWAAATELLIKGEGAEREALDRCCEQQVTGTELRLHVKRHLETETFDCRTVQVIWADGQVATITWLTWNWKY